MRWPVFLALIWLWWMRQHMINLWQPRPGVQARTGDLVFSAGTSMAALGVQAMQWCPWAHVGILIVLPEGIWVYESQSGHGVRLVEWAAWRVGHPLAHRAVTRPAEWVRARLIRHIAQHLGEPYLYPRVRPRRADGIWCSWLVAEVFGLHLARRFRPADCVTAEGWGPLVRLQADVAPVATLDAQLRNMVLGADGTPPCAQERIAAVVADAAAEGAGDGGESPGGPDGGGGRPAEVHGGGALGGGEERPVVRECDPASGCPASDGGDDGGVSEDGARSDRSGAAADLGHVGEGVPGTDPGEHAGECDV